jgi:peptidoglycan/LPS O-acetylase OafA/YrhL
VIAVLYGAVLVIGVTASPVSWTARLLNLGPLRALGKYSYGIYVYHPLLIVFTGWLFKKLSTISLIGEAPVAPVLACKIAVIAGSTFGIAWLSWHLYEKRFLVLKRYFEYDRAV